SRAETPLRCSIMSAPASKSRELRLPRRASWVTSPAVDCSTRRWVTSSPPRRTNIRASLQRRRAPSGSRMSARNGWRASSAIPRTRRGPRTPGGSRGNRTAIVAGRDARDADGGGAVYLTRFAHHCIDKALHIAGRGRSPRRVIVTDARYRMSVDALEHALEEDRRNGVQPWLVVAS